VLAGDKSDNNNIIIIMGENNNLKSRKHSANTNLLQAVFLNFFESYISCQNHFGRIAMDGWKIFSVAVLTLNFEALTVKFGTSVTNFTNIGILLIKKSQQAPRTNEQNNKPTNTHDHDNSLQGNNNKYCILYCTYSVIGKVICIGPYRMNDTAGLIDDKACLCVPAG